MKKLLLLLISVICSFNVLAQSDTITISKENKHTTIVVPQIGIVKISMVLDILNQNNYIFRDTYIKVTGKDGDVAYQTYGEGILDIITNQYKNNNFLSDSEVIVLKELLRLAQNEGVLLVEVEYPPIEKIYSDIAKSQKKAANSLATIATLNVISFVAAIIGVIFITK